MNFNDVNSILAGLEATAIMRATEVKLAALLNRRSLCRVEEIDKASKHKLSPGYILSEDELTDLRDGFSLIGSEFEPPMNILQFKYGSKYKTRYLYVNDAYPKLEVGVIKQGDGEAVARYMRFLDLN